MSVQPGGGNVTSSANHDWQGSKIGVHVSHRNRPLERCDLSATLEFGADPRRYGLIFERRRHDRRGELAAGVHEQPDAIFVEQRSLLRG
jgi:hypothetical protein